MRMCATPTVALVLFYSVGASAFMGTPSFDQNVVHDLPWVASRATGSGTRTAAGDAPRKLSETQVYACMYQCSPIDHMMDKGGCYDGICPTIAEAEVLSKPAYLGGAGQLCNGLGYTPTSRESIPLPDEATCAEYVRQAGVIGFSARVDAWKEIVTSYARGAEISRGRSLFTDHTTTSTSTTTAKDGSKTSVTSTTSGGHTGFYKFCGTIVAGVFGTVCGYFTAVTGPGAAAAWGTCFGATCGLEGLAPG